MDVTWNIETDDYGTLTASGVLGSTLPTIGVGDEITLTFFFGQELADHESSYDVLTTVGRRTNGSTIDTGLDIRGKPWYREKLHPEAPFSSTLVKIVPATDVGNVQSWWAVITDTTDQTKFVGAGEKIEVSLFVLAQGSTYNTRSDVEADLRAEL
jgi:hypothetical protein